MKSYEQYCNIYLESAFFFSIENKEVKKMQNGSDYVSNFRVLREIIVGDRAYLSAL